MRDGGIADRPGRPEIEPLIARFAERSARIGVIGLGYVGLPLVRRLAEQGFAVLGFDIESDKVERLNRGESYIRHIAAESIAGLRRSGRFAATADFSRLGEPDAVILCVPTPLTRQREPDLSFVVRTTEALAPHLRPGQLIVLESTTYPGTTRDVMRPILERSGLRSGRDFFLAYSPEREDPGNPSLGIGDIPKVVGGDGPEALRLARALYDAAAASTVPVSSLDTAEAVKLTENIFRAVNIALVNEEDRVRGDGHRRVGGDRGGKNQAVRLYAVLSGAGPRRALHPDRPTWKAREFRVTTRFIELAGEINTAMPQRVAEKAVALLSERAGRAIKGARVLIIGVAYKKNVDDTRESPALIIMELLEARSASVAFHDPFLPEIPPTREHAKFAGRRSTPLTADALAATDIAIICTDHDAVDYRLLVERGPIIIDTRNICGRRGLMSDRIVKA